MVALKGFLMGAANVIPGVSGGTIAFLTGIYQELIESIKAIGGKNLGLLFKGKFAQFWTGINGNFLLSLALGVLLSIFSLAKLITYTLAHYPVETWAIFFGLILASSWYMFKDLRSRNRTFLVDVAYNKHRNIKSFCCAHEHVCALTNLSDTARR